MIDNDTNIKSCDNSPSRVHYINAKENVEKGNLINALALLTMSLVADEKFVDAYLMRANVLLSMGDILNAEKDVDDAQTIIGETEDVLMLKARIECAKGNDGEAITHYSKALETNPKNVDALKERGKLYYKMGLTKEAQKDVETLLKLNPDAINDVNGSYTADGVEQKHNPKHSIVNPLGL